MERSLFDYLRHRAETSPGATAIASGAPSGWESVTWAQLYAAASGVARRARTLPVGDGPVVLAVDNSVACAAVLLGLAGASVDLLLVEAANSYLTDEQSPIVRAAPSAMVGPAEFAATASARFPCVRFDELMAGPLSDVPPRRASVIHQLTSGSTGEHRIVCHPLNNVLRGGIIYRDVHGLTTADTLFVTVPLAHSFGLVGGLAAALVSGARLLTLTRFNLRVLLAGLRDGATVLLSTPLGYDLIASVTRPAQRDNSLRLALSSGGPLSADVAARAAQRLGVRVHQVYGSTETGLVACAYDRQEPWPDGSVGTFAPGVEWRLAQDDSTDGTGRLLVRTSTMFDRYLDGQTVGAGHYDTGDLVRVDAQGHVFVMARKNTFVNVGGRKVNPRRIERVLADCAGVVESFVYGAESDGAEQEIHAAVVLAGSTGVPELLGFCRARLMPYEVPHRVHVLAELPRTALGKVHLHRLIDAVSANEATEFTGRQDMTQPTGDYVAVVGLGYVGLPLALLLARSGQRVVGVDLDPEVRAALAAGNPRFVEPGVAELLDSVPPERFTVSDRLPEVAPQAVVICVGTAVDLATGEPDLAHLRSASAHVAEHMSAETLVVVRSTVPVGTCRDTVLPILRTAVDAPMLAMCPERIIQGQAVREIETLPQIIGAIDERARERAAQLLKPVAADQVLVSALETAEMVKLVCNAHTDLIYGFGNEVALMSAALGIDANEVIASANLRYPRPDLSRPGFVGGSCLIKDPYLLIHGAEAAGYRPSMVAAARSVNERVPQHVIDLVLKALAATGRAPADAKILVCGIAYKGRPVTDDVRGAASVEIAAALRDRVAVLGGHDFVVEPRRIAGLGYQPMDLADGLTDSDALILLVDHPGYAKLTAEFLCARMRKPAIVFDMWGALDGELSGAHDIDYLRLGRG
ncbi:nucleotide sugar dehydrogenase [Nocardia sp. NPDC057030]|uniref:nucleotide sugar dehydrogenase n=1 Tax=unclassified Nocardia TaxID=2637762 RepID=UPI00362FD5E3